MREPVLAIFLCWGALQLGACGKGLYTSDPRGPADAAFDKGGSRGDAARDYRTPVDNGMPSEDDAIGDDGGVTSVRFKSGEGGPVALGDALVTVRSGTFSEDVTITVRAIPAPRMGPVGTVYRIEQAPSGAHARIAV